MNQARSKIGVPFFQRNEWYSKRRARLDFSIVRVQLAALEGEVSFFRTNN